MPTAAEHYENLLAAHYTWMFGTSFAEKVAEQKSILAQTLPPPQTPQLAVDLGSGPGFQTIALAELGYSPVLALDTSAQLLTELRSHASSLPIQTHHADLRDLSAFVAPASAAAIVCMGDTLTHLPAKFGICTLFQSIANALAPGGVFVLTWRDLTADLHGLDRFLPIRSDDAAIMTCFLESDPADPDHVLVHDLIYTRDADGAWTLNKSSYPKLRLSPAWLTEQLTIVGLNVDPPTTAGRLLQLTARKPS